MTTSMLIAASLAFPAWAASPDPGASVTAEELPGLIRDVDSPSFRTREAAGRRLYAQYDEALQRVFEDDAALRALGVEMPVPDERGAVVNNHLSSFVENIRVDGPAAYLRARLTERCRWAGVRTSDRFDLPGKVFHEPGAWLFDALTENRLHACREEDMRLVLDAVLRRMSWAPEEQDAGLEGSVVLIVQFYRLEDRLPDLLARLESPHAPVRAAAASALGRLWREDSEFVPILLRLADDGSPEVLAAAFQVLAERAPDAAVPVARNIVLYPPEDGLLVREAALLLGTYGRDEDSLSALAGLLDNSDWVYRYAAIQAIGDFCRSVPADEPLGAFARNEVRAPLRRLCDGDGNVKVREYARRLLARIGSAR